MRCRFSGRGIQSAYGAGIEPLVTGIHNLHCPQQPAEGIGYPGESAPLASSFPDARASPGEAPAAQRLLETVDTAVNDTERDSASIAAPDCGLFIGTGGFLYASTAELYWRALHPGAAQTAFRVREPAWGGALIGARYGLRGPSLTISSGCSSSANALLLATEAIARDEIRRALVVGAEGVNAVSLAGFDSLMLLDPAGCRPFDRDRAGLQLGEAVAALIVEPDDGTARGVVLRGGATLCDTHHLTGASPDGEVMQAVMAAALERSAVRVGEVIAVKAHGTGSFDSDRAEANALAALFGHRHPPITALKRYLGHTLGACGAAETLAFAACLEAGFIPAAAGFAIADPDLPITPIQRALPAQRGVYLLNFFGFGGNYTALVIELRMSA